MHCQLGQMERAVERSGGVGKRCQHTSRSERQEILKGMVEDKNYVAEPEQRKSITSKLLRRMKKLEEKKSKEALLLVTGKARFVEISE